MKKRISYEIKVPDTDATADQIEDWIVFNVFGGRLEKQPLSQRPMEPFYGSLEIEDA